MMHVNWIVTQIGSREHYGVPRGFEHIGHLKLLYTDVWCRRPLGLLRYGNAAMRAIAGRWNAEIPSTKVVSFNTRAFAHALGSLRRKQSIDEQYSFYLRVGGEFDRSVVRHLQRRGKVDPRRDAFFGYNTGSLQSIQFCKQRGMPTVLNQIDPAKTEEDIVAREAAKWPEWEKSPGRIPQAYWDHMQAEWAAADLVVVNSEWCMQALVQQGVPPEKLRIVPLTYQPEAAGNAPAPRAGKGPLTVLWLGSVILRKGIQYLIEAAKLLDAHDFRFVVAGPIGISRAAVASAPSNMSFVGRVTRDGIGQFYRQADVFVLPTLSDGFAITQVEAMAHGLPVITTPNCGKVVTPGVDGLIVPAGDAPSLAAAIATLHADRELLAQMSRNALVRSAHFLIPTQALRIEAALSGLPNPR
ncbi:MAG: glycosyltransferase family 4 protein [Tepidisphaeraceae bacterium]|jgi:glycosyltransferase involved in cell wall biosynthesis